MRTLPADLIIHKNLLSSTDPWKVLLDISVPDGSTLRLVNDIDNVTYDGNLYTALPFEFDQLKHISKGKLSEISLKVANPLRSVQAELEAYSGLVGETVTMYIVNKAHLAVDYTELTFTFEIINSSANAMWVTFTLGAANPMGMRFPLYRYIADYCRYACKYKGVECKSTSSDTSCNGNLLACQNHTSEDNSYNFGGFIGLAKGGVKLAN